MRIAPVVDLNRVHGAMRAAGLDLLLVNSPANVWYLSGYPLGLSGLQGRGYGRNAVVLVPANADPILVPGAFEEEISRARAWVKDIEPFEDYVTAPVVGAARVVLRRGLARGRVGIEQEHLSDRFGELLREALPDSELVPADELLDEVRAVKAPEEIAGMEQTLRLTTEAAAAALKEVRAGQREVDARTGLTVAIVRALWSEKVDGSVLSGSRVRLWNGQSGERRLDPGDWVRIDFTCARGGYAARLCRTGTVGEPTQEQKGIFSRYAEACRTALGRLRPQSLAEEAYTLISQELSPVGRLVGPAGFGLGYGPVERPYLIHGEKRRLMPGMVLSIEPMIEEGLCSSWCAVVEDERIRLVESVLPPDALFVIGEI